MMLYNAAHNVNYENECTVYIQIVHMLLENPYKCKRKHMKALKTHVIKHDVMTLRPLKALKAL